MFLPYMEDFNSRWGFGNRVFTNDGIEIIRRTNIMIINRLAKRFNSEFRAVAWNASSGDNPYFICAMPITTFNSLSYEQINYGSNMKGICLMKIDDKCLDDKWAKMVDYIDELDIHDDVLNMVKLTASVDGNAYESLLKKL